MDFKPLYQGNSIFRNQPSYTLFNKTFEEAKDVLFLQIEEINPHFLTEAQLNDTSGFSQNILLDPRTKKEQMRIEYDHSVKGNKQKPFKGGGIKSALTKEQHKVGLSVLLAQQNHYELDEAELIIWHKFQTTLLKERCQMQEYIREFEEANKEEIYAPAKRLDDLFKEWFLKERESYAKSQPDELTFNTHTGLPLLNHCKTINEEAIHITDVELLRKRGFVRLYREEYDADWQNFNFRLHCFSRIFNENQGAKEHAVFAKEINDELASFDEKCIDQKFYIPFKTLLFILNPDDIDLPKEVLLEIKNVPSIGDGKIIAFETPLPAHNCGYHTHQQVVEQSFAAFISAKGRADWIAVNQDDVKVVQEHENNTEVGGVDLSQYKPLPFEEYLFKNISSSERDEAEDIKQNNALLKWYLKSVDAECGIKIVTTLKLPPAVNIEANKFLACEFFKLEFKPQFGCELFTKHELLSAWLQMRLISFISTDFGICYRLSANDLGQQLKQRLTLQQIEQLLAQHYRINPNQLINNLAEFLKLLSNMPAGKYLLRYNPKFSDKFLLCAKSKEITANTVFLHKLFEGVPTSLAWMTQQNFLPISETLCSAVHIDNKILPCTFLPLLPGQKNLETADSRFKKRNNFMTKIANQNSSKVKEKELKSRHKAPKRKRKKKKAKGSKTAEKDQLHEEILIV